MDWLFALIVWAVGLLCALAFFAGAQRLKDSAGKPLRGSGKSHQPARSCCDD